MIKNRITLKQLEAFVCVLDAGSFRKAAAVLGTTQPNISNRIASLEESLNVVLMHRDAGSVRLTETGETLLASARDVLRAAESLVEAAGRKDLIADRLRLGATELIACTWLHPFLRSFRANYPGVSVELEVDLSTEIEQKLAAGQIDLALMAGPVKQESGEAGTSLGNYPYAWIAAASASPAKNRAALSDLMASGVLVHSRNTAAARELVAFCGKNGVLTDRIVYSSSLTSAVQMAVDKMGTALVPKAIAQTHLASGTLVEVSCDWLPRPLEFHAQYDPTRAPGFVKFAATLASEVSGQTQDNFL